MGKHGNRGFKHRSLRLDVRHLLHESEANLRLADDLTGVGFYAAGDDPEEGCLACAVAPNESDLFIGIQLEAGLLKDCLASEALADVIEMDKHGKADREQPCAAIKKGQPELPLKSLFS